MFVELKINVTKMNLIFILIYNNYKIWKKHLFEFDILLGLSSNM